MTEQAYEFDGTNVAHEYNTTGDLPGTGEVGRLYVITGGSTPDFYYWNAVGSNYQIIPGPIPKPKKKKGV